MIEIGPFGHKVCFAPKYNSKGKHDATGAFQPEMKKFSGVGVLFDNHATKHEQRCTVLNAIELQAEKHGKINCVAFFCHGWKTGIQPGFNLQNVDELALAISTHCLSNVKVVLFCCSVAGGPGPGGDGGFADILRDRLCALGSKWCRVYGHDRKGHTTNNPFVRVFEGRGSPLGATGGQYLVDPKNKKAFSTWRRLLRTTNLKWRFPFMEISEVHDEIIKSC